MKVESNENNFGFEEVTAASEEAGAIEAKETIEDGGAEGAAAEEGAELGDLGDEFKAPVKEIPEGDAAEEGKKTTAKEVIKEDVADVVEPELNSDQILAFINKDRPDDEKFKTLDEVYAPKEVEKIVEKTVNPYEDLLDDTDKAYFKYKKEHGGTRKEFDFINRDLSGIPSLDLAIEKIQNESGIELSDGDAKKYLEQKLNIDFSVGLSKNDEIEVATFANDYKKELETRKNKLITPVENSEVVEKKVEAPVNTSETITLENGNVMTKEGYDKLVNGRKEYIQNTKDAVNSVAASNFNVELDINGEKKVLDFNYEFSKEDKHSMLSDALDVDSTVNKRWKTEKGLDHKSLAEGVWWGDKKNQLKVMNALAEKVRAQTIEEVLADTNNETFKVSTLPKKEKKEDGYGSLTGKQDKSGFGVMYDFS